MPNDDFESSPADTFTYVAHDGLWTDGSTPMSPDSSPATVTITVVSRHTITDLFSSKNPSVYGDTVTFTAIVTPVSPQLGTPTGTVTFKDGATTLGTGTLSAGQATFSTASLPSLLNAGPHSITAVYCGNTSVLCPPDPVFYGSTSTAMTQTIQKAHLTVTAGNKIKTYDGALYSPFTATLTGFREQRNGRRTARVRRAVGRAALSGAAIAAIGAGSYPITPAGGHPAATNYDFPVFIEGTLTINKANAIIVVVGYNVVFDGNPHTAGGSAIGVEAVPRI